MTFEMLTFLHTSPTHVDTFNVLLCELAPDLPVQHIIDEAILREARDAGRLTEAMQAKVWAQIAGGQGGADGAAHHCGGDLGQHIAADKRLDF